VLGEVENVLQEPGAGKTWRVQQEVARVFFLAYTQSHGCALEIQQRRHLQDGDALKKHLDDIAGLGQLLDVTGWLQLHK